MKSPFKHELGIFVRFGTLDAITLFLIVKHGVTSACCEKPEIMLQPTRRERLKSALYLRLKKRKVFKN